MISFNSKLWTAHDPDKLLSFNRDHVALTTANLLDHINPREDLIYFQHTESHIIIDYGYYGCEVELNGKWSIYVIDGNIEDAWENPIEKHTFPFHDFMLEIKYIENLILKYT